MVICGSAVTSRRIAMSPVRCPGYEVFMRCVRVDEEVGEQWDDEDGLEIVTGPSPGRR
jgi:hypothetical protein